MPHLQEPVTVTLEYTDGDGIETRRDVDIYRTRKEKGFTMLTGFCHGRQAERAFRSDRVRSVITQDGEVLTISEFMGDLLQHQSSEVYMQGLPEEELENVGRLQQIWTVIKGIAAIAFILWTTGHALYLWATEGGWFALGAFVAYWAIAGFVFGKTKQ